MAKQPHNSGRTKNNPIERHEPLLLEKVEQLSIKVNCVYVLSCKYDKQK